jgi:type II secretory pathway component PulF
VRRFHYRAVDPAAREEAGEIEAKDHREAAAKLQERELLVTALWAEPLGPEPAPPVADAFVLFNEGLAELTRLRIPMPDALRELSQRLRGSELQSVLRRVEARVREGCALPDALASEKNLPAYYTALVRAGAEAGDLPAVLSAVAVDVSRLRQLERIVRRAMIYPCVVFLMLGGLAVFYLRTLAPVLRDVYELASVSMPAILRDERLAAAAVCGPPVVVGALVIGAIFFALIASRSAACERAARRLPILGTLIHHVAFIRFVTALRLLMQARVPAPAAVGLAARGAGSPILRRALPRLEQALGEGGPISSALSADRVFRPGMIAYLAWGERTGRAAESLSHLSETAIEEAARTARAIQASAEPVATLLAGLTMAAMILPIVIPYTTLLRRLSEFIP